MDLPCSNRTVHITREGSLRWGTKASTVAVSNTDLLPVVVMRRPTCGTIRITKTFVVTLEHYRKVWYPLNFSSILSFFISCTWWCYWLILSVLCRCSCWGTRRLRTGPRDVLHYCWLGSNQSHGHRRGLQCDLWNIGQAAKSNNRLQHQIGFDGILWEWFNTNTLRTMII